MERSLWGECCIGTTTYDTHTRFNDLQPHRYSVSGHAGKERVTNMDTKKRTLLMNIPVWVTMSLFALGASGAIGYGQDAREKLLAPAIAPAVNDATRPGMQGPKIETAMLADPGDESGEKKRTRKRAKQGTEVMYSAKGKKLSETPFVDGEREGIATTYYSSGKVWTRTPYHNDHISGMVTGFYENGKRRSERPYQRGRKDGMERFYRESGAVWYETPYMDGMKQGTKTFFSKNGSKEMEVVYKNDERHGMKTEYYPNGQMKSQTNYEGDIKVGVETGFYENGKKSYEIPYVDGKEDGIVQTWSRSGELKSVPWKNGMLVQ